MTYSATITRRDTGHITEVKADSSYNIGKELHGALSETFINVDCDIVVSDNGVPYRNYFFSNGRLRAVND